MITIKLTDVREWKPGDRLEIVSVRTVGPGRWEWIMKPIKKEG